MVPTLESPRAALSDRWWSREDVETALRSEWQSGPEMVREYGE
jgi:hypothetical protein